MPVPSHRIPPRANSARDPRWRRLKPEPQRPHVAPANGLLYTRWLFHTQPGYVLASEPIHAFSFAAGVRSTGTGIRFDAVASGNAFSVRCHRRQGQAGDRQMADRREPARVGPQRQKTLAGRMAEEG